MGKRFLLGSEVFVKGKGRKRFVVTLGETRRTIKGKRLFKKVEPIKNGKGFFVPITKLKVAPKTKQRLKFEKQFRRRFAR